MIPTRVQISSVEKAIALICRIWVLVISLTGIPVMNVANARHARVTTKPMMVDMISISKPVLKIPKIVSMI